MDGVANLHHRKTSTPTRPRHAQAAHNTYTLKCDDPVKAAQGYEFLGGMRRMIDQSRHCGPYRASYGSEDMI